MQHPDVARLVVIANCLGEVTQRLHRVAVFHLECGQPVRQLLLKEAVSAFLRDEHATSQRLERAAWISLTDGIPECEKCVDMHPCIADRFGGFEEAVGGYHRVASRTGGG